MEKKNESNDLRDAMLRLNEKLETMRNGEVVNDTMVDHLKKAVENIVDNHNMADDMVKAGVPPMASEWLLFLFAVMSAGALPEEAMTAEFKEGVERFAREHGFEEKMMSEV